MSKDGKLSRDGVFESICKATRIDTLGLFIGSGFSKALLEGDNHFKSYSWSELLRRVSDDFNITRDVLNEGKPYSEVASVICFEYAKAHSISHKEAERQMKFKIAEIVNVIPSNHKIKEYETIFARLNPNWIVTTNYDSIIEQIIREKALPINPKDTYIKIRDFTPVYHIHGSIFDPESIVITNEDYIHTLRISDYRHARLPFIIKESTVLMIGYSLNDLNVLSAVDYSKNVYSNDMSYDTPIIQLLYKKNPNNEPYYSDDGIIIQEVSNLSDYFLEYLEFEKRYRGQIGKVTKQVNELVELLSNADEGLVISFISDSSFRLKYIHTISGIAREFWYIYSSYTAFLNKCFGLLWNKASAYGAFEEYNNILCLLLDIIENLDYDNSPLSFVDYLVNNFSEIALFVGNEKGQSYSAFSTWELRKVVFPERFVEEYIKRRKDDYNYKCGLTLIKSLDLGDSK